MPNFQNGKIYAIRSYLTEQIYIGSTTQPLSVRFGEHKRNLKTMSKQIMKYPDCYIELLQEFACDNKMQLTKKEGEYIRSLECVNKQIPNRTNAEWSEDNKIHLLEYRKNYQQKNREIILKKHENYRKNNPTQYKDWYQNNKSIRTCACGSHFNESRKSTKEAHYNSKKHIDWVDDFYDRLHTLLTSE